LMLLAFVALVVDLGFGLTVKTQLQQVADAAALAGAAHLNGTLDGVNAAKADAIVYAAKNRAAGYPVELIDDDVEFGYWDMLAKTFSRILPGQVGFPEDINAVRVTCRRNTARGTGLATTFARVFGRTTMDVKASAVAQVGGPSRCVDSDDPELDCNLDIPIVLCKDAITQVDGSPNCGVEITVGATPTQSGALTSYYKTANDPNIRSYVDGDTPSIYAKPCSQCPINLSTSDKSGIEVTQGVQPGVFADMRKKYEEKVAPCITSGSGPSCEYVNGKLTWKAFVAVVCVDCDTPSMTSGPACVTGFAKINIEEVCTSQGNTPCDHTGQAKSSTNAVYGRLKCGDLGPGNNLGTGGPLLGTYSPIPGLVQ